MMDIEGSGSELEIIVSFYVVELMVFNFSTLIISVLKRGHVFLSLGKLQYS